MIFPGFACFLEGYGMSQKGVLSGLFHTFRSLRFCTAKCSLEECQALWISASQCTQPYPQDHRTAGPQDHRTTGECKSKSVKPSAKARTREETLVQRKANKFGFRHAFIVVTSLQHFVEKDSEAVTRLSLERHDWLVMSVIGISIERVGTLPLYLLPPL